MEAGATDDEVFGELTACDLDERDFEDSTKKRQIFNYRFNR